MDDESMQLKKLERRLIDDDATVEPVMLLFDVLKTITNDFHEVIGEGGFGVVYKGVVKNREVAVKKLLRSDEFSEKQFQDEVTCLTRVNHKNIVKFLGYCSTTHKKLVQLDGDLVWAEVRQRFLCFEYVPNKSLYDFLEDKSRGREWSTRFQLIKGICQGLDYLHNKERINHLDLKPDNILLDVNLVPKITDFGLSRRFGGDQSRMITEHVFGTRGFTAPEFLDGGLISFKSDIYSLGIIIIKILRGSNDVPNLKNWHESLDLDGPHIQKCIEIAQTCADPSEENRPNIGDIVDTLNTMEDIAETSSHQASSCIFELSDELQSMDVSAAPAPSPLQQIICVPKELGNLGSAGIHPNPSETGKLLDVHPMELCFPFEQNKRVGCPMTVTNRTGHFVAVSIAPTDQYTLFDFHFPVLLDNETLEEEPRYPMLKLMEPHSTWAVTMTMKEQQQPPRRDTAKVVVYMIVLRSKYDLENLKSSVGFLNMDSEFFKQVEGLGAEVHRAILTTTVIFDRTTSQSQSQTVTHQVISTEEYDNVLSYDVHPTETWILRGHSGGYVCIWNYQKEEKVTTLQITKEAGIRYALTHFDSRPRVYSVKFIARKQWLAAGDGYGYIHVYAYPVVDTVKKFKAYRGHQVSLLAVHPTYPFLLSSSDFDYSIKLWNWEQGWACTQRFNGHTSTIYHLTFNPRDINTLASFSSNTANIWNIQSSKPIATVLAGPERANYFFTYSHQHFLVGIQSDCAHVWDWQTKECVHRLAVCGRKIVDVACHPTFPILVTGLDDGTVCFWDANTYRLEKMFHLGCRHDESVFNGTNNLTRITAGSNFEIRVTQINLPAVTRNNLWSLGW